MKISTPFISFGLKIVGAIMLIASLVDYLFLLIPLEWQNQNWQINTTNSLVDRGIVPLLAIILIMIGWWISDNASNNLGKPIPAIRLSVFTISSLLGLLFLLLVPLHLSNVNRASANVSQQIEQRAGQQEEQIQNFTTQLDAIAKNPQQLSQQIAQRNQVIKAGQFQGRQLTQPEIEQITNQRDQLQQLLDLSKDPAQLNAKLEELKTRLETQLRDLKEQQKNRANLIAWKQSLRTGVNSFILSMGYIALGWLGIKSMGGQSKKSPRKA
jgi:hypothetical protein